MRARRYFVGSDHNLPHFWPLGYRTQLFTHDVTLHFIVNDIFMVFFFGLAAKEVTEACLPGGSLNPPRKALSPLIGTIGGVVGPIAVFLLVNYALFMVGAFDGYESKYALAAREQLLTAAAGGVDAGHIVDARDASAHRRMLGGGGGDAGLVVDAANFNFSSPEAALGLPELMHGWGVPCATDISLAWMVAAQVFPIRHPAIEFLLLLAVADDAIGLVIIATAYGDPGKLQPLYLLLVLAGMLASAALRRVPHRIRDWWPLYLLVGGLPCWVGLISAHLHPALALCFVVPLMPATTYVKSRSVTSPTETSRSSNTTAAVAADTHGQAHSGALHAFEHALKLPVDLGMFFFTLANAGVQVNNVGPLTLTIFLSLLVGKLLGVLVLVVIADRCRLAPLNARMKAPDVAMVGTMAGIGLTVALFVAGEAYEQTRLQGEAKLGALLSGLIGAACLAYAKSPCWARRFEALKKAQQPMVGGDTWGVLDGAPRLRSEHYDYDDVADIVAATLERSLLLSRASEAKSAAATPTAWV